MFMTRWTEIAEQRKSRRAIGLATLAKDRAFLRGGLVSAYGVLYVYGWIFFRPVMCA